ncbi:MAG TPA: ABC transporter permease [Thermoanaerobaculia bacterium]|jgi:ABC-2 type transport system permease protein
MGMRVTALLMRYLYLYRRSVARAMAIVFWPVVDLLVWGFVTAYLQRIAVPEPILFLLGGVIFWDVFYSSAQAITLSVTEEIWGRNILNIFVAPVRVSELMLATCLLGGLRALASTTLLSILAWILYAFHVTAVGFVLAPFLASLLLFGWAMGIFTMALILRYGQAAEALIWGMPFLIQPLSAVFYPLSVLPAWLQPIARGIPSTYVFEGMRSALRQGTVDPRLLFGAFALDLAYLAAAAVFFAWMLEKVRERGYLGRLGLE